MRKLLSILTLAMLVLGTGCDSGDGDQTDTELFVRTWTITTLRDAQGDRTESFYETVEEFEINLDDDGTYDLLVLFEEGDPRPDVDLSGAYTVIEASNTLRLAVTLPTGAANLDFIYDFEDEDRVNLSATGATVAVVNALFQTNYSGTVTLTIEPD